MSTDLFGTAPVPSATHGARPERDTFFAVIEAARRKLGVGKQWDWIHLDGRRHATHGTIVTGGVRNASGGFKGVPRTKVIVTDAECAFETAEYERTTGKCAACSGYGDRFRGYSPETGTRYEPCTKCAGTGKAR
jgi:hypothetical protein